MDTMKTGTLALLILAGTVAATPRSSAAPAAGPREVLIVRNAEEPKGSDIHLSDDGKTRAKTLAQWVPATYGNPDVLIASQPTDKSRRSIETLEPIAAALRLKIHSDFSNDDFAKMVDKIKNDAAFAGKRVLICWNRGNIQNIALALGVKQPPAWPDGQYDHLWRLQFDAGKVTLEDIKQR
jgi:phosphohistidine phosphatase SixA